MLRGRHQHDGAGGVEGWLGEGKRRHGGKEHTLPGHVGGGTIKGGEDMQKGQTREGQAEALLGRQPSSRCDPHCQD